LGVNLNLLTVSAIVVSANELCLTLICRCSMFLRPVCPCFHEPAAPEHSHEHSQFRTCAATSTSINQLIRTETDTPTRRPCSLATVENLAWSVSSQVKISHHTALIATRHSNSTPRARKVPAALSAKTLYGMVRLFSFPFLPQGHDTCHSPPPIYLP